MIPFISTIFKGNQDIEFAILTNLSEDVCPFSDEAVNLEYEPFLVDEPATMDFPAEQVWQW